MIYILGASGQGKVVADVIENLGLELGGFYDDIYSPSCLEHNGFALLNTIQATSNAPSQEQFHIAIGVNTIRKKVAEQKHQLNYPVLIHPSAVISKSARIGAGTICMAGSIVQPDACIGAHCIINTNASIDHDCVLDDFAQIAPGATVCGHVHIGECSYVGAGVVIKQGIRVGKNVMIGAGAVVVKDVPDDCMVFGNPAKLIKQGIFV